MWLDYTGFSTRLGELASLAGIAPFNVAEESLIRSNILTGLNTAYSEFTVNFSETAPGGAFPTIAFGLTGGGLGVADHIDYRNKAVADVARVFTANFDFIVDEFSGFTNRATQISQLSTALAGTAAHELGHNLGLRHHDAYGVSSLSYTGSPVATGGSQNASILATGSTGLGEAGRESVRTFSDLSRVKLSFAAGIGASVPATDFEGADFGGTTGTAHPVSFSGLGSVPFFAANVAGTIGNTADADVFAVSLQAGSTFTADVNIDFPTGIAFENVNTLIELVAPDGSTIIASDLVSAYSAFTFGTGSSGDGFDPILINVPIPTSGTYFLRLAPEVPDTGDYELLMYTDMIPAPASLALAGFGALAIARRRRSA